MILLSHPTGNEFVRAALDAFDCAGSARRILDDPELDSKSPINLAVPRRSAKFCSAVPFQRQFERARAPFLGGNDSPVRWNGGLAF